MGVIVGVWATGRQGAHLRCRGRANWDSRWRLRLPSSHDGPARSPKSWRCFWEHGFTASHAYTFTTTPRLPAACAHADAYPAPTPHHPHTHTHPHPGDISPTPTPPKTCLPTHHHAARPRLRLHCTRTFCAHTTFCLHRFYPGPFEQWAALRTRGFVVRLAVWLNDRTPHRNCRKRMHPHPALFSWFTGHLHHAAYCLGLPPPHAAPKLFPPGHEGYPTLLVHRPSVWLFLLPSWTRFVLPAMDHPTAPPPSLFLALCPFTFRLHSYHLFYLVLGSCFPVHIPIYWTHLWVPTHCLDVPIHCTLRSPQTPPTHTPSGWITADDGSHTPRVGCLVRPT